ncbi:hypothetical protein KSD_81970 [Ktedonobacter sp. SOSP1-85]|uniref:hypothetical protein n=1 Tax=Ktedonobacter sp. SOSP1-85 TaxID=2778367 RepID=UPI0019157E69|nr:hypothetical protein [Ktedonobacter sp. SOSP1-85]GHO80426.1 hypothetical protein KSD_81970 [Ktedonobacter sp. SOSP1-85]
MEEDSSGPYGMLSQEALLDALCDPMTRATSLMLREEYQPDETGKSDPPMKLTQAITGTQDSMSWSRAMPSHSLTMTCSNASPRYGAPNGMGDGNTRGATGGLYHKNGGMALVFEVKPTKILAFAKGTFSHTRHQF